MVYLGINSFLEYLFVLNLTFYLWHRWVGGVTVAPAEARAPTKLYTTTTTEHHHHRGHARLEIDNCTTPLYTPL